MQKLLETERVETKAVRAKVEAEKGQMAKELSTAKKELEVARRELQGLQATHDAVRAKLTSNDGQT